MYLLLLFAFDSYRYYPSSLSSLINPLWRILFSASLWSSVCDPNYARLSELIEKERILMIMYLTELFVTSSLWPTWRFCNFYWLSANGSGVNYSWTKNNEFQLIRPLQIFKGTLFESGKSPSTFSLPNILLVGQVCFFGNLSGCK